jgi:hypothetical protein
MLEQHPTLVVGLMREARAELLFPEGPGLDHTRSAFSDVTFIARPRFIFNR